MATSKYLAIEHVAARLGVPTAWLRREVENGRVPCLRVGRRLLLDPAAVNQALSNRTKEVNEGAGDEQ